MKISYSLKNPLKIYINEKRKMIPAYQEIQWFKFLIEIKKDVQTILKVTLQLVSKYSHTKERIIRTFLLSGQMETRKVKIPLSLSRV